MRSSALRLATLAPVLAIALGAGATTATATDAAVRSACSGDYHRYCPSYPVGSSQLRSCMKAVGKRLSPRCVDALVDAGEISRKEAQRRR
jgi:ABC-type sugar transport system substrate-binding protein